jgi:chromosome partitioning protein
MRKIAIVGFKGGIGKTTTCVNLGAGLAMRGHRVLLIDTDTQANLAVCLGLKDYQKSLTDLLIRKAKAKDCIIPARKNLDLLPSNLGLFKTQQRMVLELAREEILSEVLAEIEGYDYQLIDCAPSLSLLTVNALVYADEIFVPVSMEMLAIAALKQLMKYLQSIADVPGGGATLRLIIPTMYDERRRISKQIISLLQGLGPPVTRPIRIDTQLSEAPGHGKTIYEYARRSRGVADYAWLCETVATLPPLAHAGSQREVENQVSLEPGGPG